jgi:lycopene cyclase domain-containing protein
MSTYLAVDLLSLGVPLLFTLAGPWRADGREWLRILAAVAGVAVPFIAWDAAFTARGVWSFNPDHLTGLRLFGLPLEEVLFFICIPFACLFIYRVARSRLPMAIPRGPLRALWMALAAACALAALPALAQGRAYSLSAFGLAALGLAWHARRLPSWSGHFLAALALHYLPFFLVNGILTALPVVLYDGGEFYGFRIGSIPVEDAAYSLCLLLANVTLYEALAPRPGAAAAGGKPGNKPTFLVTGGKA